MKERTFKGLNTYTGLMRVWHALRSCQRLSKIGLTEVTGLSPAAVTVILKDLEGKSVIREAGKSAEREKSGRRRTFVELNDEKIVVAHVTVKDNMIHAGVTGLDQHPYFSYEMDLIRVFSANELIDHIADILTIGIKAIPSDAELFGLGVFYSEETILNWEMSGERFCALCRKRLAEPFLVESTTWLEREILSLHQAERGRGNGVIVDLRDLTVTLCNYPEDMMYSRTLQLANIHSGPGKETLRGIMVRAAQKEGTTQRSADKWPAAYLTLLQDCAQCFQTDEVYALHCPKVAVSSASVLDAEVILGSDYAQRAKCALIADYSIYYAADKKPAGRNERAWKRSGRGTTCKKEETGEIL